MACGALHAIADSVTYKAGAQSHSHCSLTYDYCLMPIASLDLFVDGEYYY